jgi:hypothetical protein
MIILRPRADGVSLAAIAPVVAAALWAGASLLTKSVLALDVNPSNWTRFG